ncbi:MAG: hypothetical protein OHK0022_41980 [Roseiflexaceae bacterium]
MESLMLIALIAMSVLTLLNMRARPPQVIVLAAPAPDPQRAGCLPRLALVALLILVLALLSALMNG